MSDPVIPQLRSLAWSPSVAIAVVETASPMQFNRLHAPPNLLLAQSIRSDDAVSVYSWSQMLFVSARNPLLLQQVASSSSLPMIAVRSLPLPLPIVEARAACDDLQRDLAPLGEFAGYIV